MPVNRRKRHGAAAGSAGRHVGTECGRNSGDLPWCGGGPQLSRIRTQPKTAGAKAGVGGGDSSEEAGQCPWSGAPLVVPRLKWTEARRRLSCGNADQERRRRCGNSRTSCISVPSGWRRQRRGPGYSQYPARRLYGEMGLYRLPTARPSAPAHA